MDNDIEVEGGPDHDPLYPYDVWMKYEDDDSHYELITDWIEDNFPTASPDDYYLDRTLGDAFGLSYSLWRFKNANIAAIAKLKFG